METMTAKPGNENCIMCPNKWCLLRLSECGIETPTTQESFKFYECVEMGPLTVQIWKIFETAPTPLEQQPPHTTATHNPTPTSIPFFLPPIIPTTTLPSRTNPRPHTQLCSTTSTSPLPLKTITSTFSMQPPRNRFFGGGLGVLRGDTYQVNVYKEGSLIQPFELGLYKVISFINSENEWPHYRFTREQLCAVICALMGINGVHSPNCDMLEKLYMRGVFDCFQQKQNMDW